MSTLCRELPVPAESLLIRLGWARVATDRGLLVWKGETQESGQVARHHAWIRWVGVSLEAQLCVRYPTGPSRLVNLQWDVNPFGGAQLTACHDTHGVLEVGRGIRQFRDALSCLGRAQFLAESSQARPVLA